MPSTTEAHRAATGTFYPILMLILGRKECECSSSRHKTKLRHTASCLKSELFSWFAVVSLSVLYCLSVLLLTRCMDVETNPGPCGNDCTSFIQSVQVGIDNRLSQIMHCLHLQSANLCKKIDEHSMKLDQSLKIIVGEVNKLKNDVLEDRSN